MRAPSVIAQRAAPVGPASGHHRVVGEDYKAPFILRYTSRADVAAAVVDEAENWPDAGRTINVFTGGF